MDRVLQAQKDASKNFQEDIDPGRVGSLLLYFVGTNNAGQVGDFDDLGDIIIKRNQETIIDRPVSIFADKGNILAGSNKFSSTDGGAFIATVKVPFYVKSFEQALQISGTNELNFSYRVGSSFDTVFDSLDLYVYTELSFLDEEYDYFLLGDDRSPAQSVDNRPYQLNVRNLAAVYLTDPDSVLTEAGLRSDGDEIYSMQPKDVLEAGTLYENRLEQTSIDMIMLQLFTDKQPGSVINKNNVLKFSTSGAGTVGISKEYIRLKNSGKGRGRLN